MNTPTQSTQGPVKLTDQTFDQVVSASNVPVLVDFWAEWCPPCRAIAPVLEELAGELGDAALVAKVDIDTNPELVERFGVSSIPTLVFLKDGKEVDRSVGVTSQSALAQRLQDLA